MTAAALVRMKWTMAVAVVVMVVAPVPVLAGIVAWGITLGHGLPWILRAA
jgi:hypothetical protein